MRLRKLLVAGLLAGAALVLAAPAAHAEDPGKKFGKELVECVEEALHDNQQAIRQGDYDGFENALEDCRKAHSLFSVALPEVIWGGLAFLIVAFVLMKFAFPALKKGLKAREQRIREDLEAASRAKATAEADLARYRATIAGARDEANRIIEDARADAERVRRDLIAKAEADAAEVRSRAQDDIRLAQERAVSDLRTRVANLSIELAEKVVERSLDRDTQLALIENYINAVGNGQR